MDVEAARKIMEDDMDMTNYGIKNAFFKGLQILSKYDENMDCSFTHDQVYICNFEDTVSKMTEEEFRKMLEYGFFEEEESWSHF